MSVFVIVLIRCVQLLIVHMTEFDLVKKVPSNFLKFTQYLAIEVLKKTKKPGKYAASRVENYPAITIRDIH